MSKDSLLKNIEEGLLNFYLEEDHSVDGEVTYESGEAYEGQTKNYERIAKQILFKARTHIRKNRVAKVISIAEASGRLKASKEKNEGKIFSIFKKHVEQHGLAANYRNFDKMTEEEMSNVLEQLDLTALFDEIDASLEDE
ncbi:MAG: hypothetical protein R2824_24185 [Saprospiraceae bacterium]|nr:hypothetical protein [Lewinella sp.]